MEKKFPTSTINQLKWKPESGRNLTQEAIDAACSASFNLAPVLGSQLVNNNPFTPSPPSFSASIQAKEDAILLCNIKRI